ncbi:MAG: hypothetical protein M3R67_14150 [Acidobacteriota bacterium]|nr:hypothetical protein [Acidobacteriota bacterium]
MERTANIPQAVWREDSAPFARHQVSVRVFASILIACACLSALFASWLPLQFSVVTLFLFAGPHNWFELRYFLMRMPVRFGRSRNFFVTAFVGIGVLTMAYLALPFLYNFRLWNDEAWSSILASWNMLLVLWLGLLVWLRGRQKSARHRGNTNGDAALRRDWSWIIPVVPGLISLNWLAPELFSLAIVYLHPLVALWFLDRHLRRTRPDWLRAYHRCLCLVPLLLLGIFWQLGRTPALPDDNGLFWRITQHAGAQLLPNISSHLLVSIHVFLEMLHYGVWLIALPLIAPSISSGAETTLPPRGSGSGAVARPSGRAWSPLQNIARRVRADHALPDGRATAPDCRGWRIWDLKAVGLARHPRGFPKIVGAVLAFGLFLVAMLWFGFSVDYSTTRDVYFTVAIAHVLAEAPFLLRML